MAKWAAEAKARCEKFYPTICQQLGTPNSRQPLSVTITFRSKAASPAPPERHIICSAEWFTEHPDDYGAVIHELCHVVQAYGNKKVPGWVTEGIADYVRWFKYEPAKRRPHVDPRHGQVHGRLPDDGGVFRLDRAHEEPLVRPTPERGRPKRKVQRRSVSPIRPQAARQALDGIHRLAKEEVTRIGAGTFGRQRLVRGAHREQRHVCHIAKRGS